MYKQDLAVNSLQGLICLKIQPTNQPTMLQFSEEEVVFRNIFLQTHIDIRIQTHSYIDS